MCVWKNKLKFVPNVWLKNRLKIFIKELMVRLDVFVKCVGRYIVYPMSKNMGKLNAEKMLIKDITKQNAEKTLSTKTRKKYIIVQKFFARNYPHKKLSNVFVNGAVPHTEYQNLGMMLG